MIAEASRFDLRAYQRMIGSGKGLYYVVESTYKDKKAPSLKETLYVPINCLLID